MTFLLLAGAFCVHQLRYLLVFGDDSAAALSDHGHGYLAFGGPTLGLLSGLVLARWLRRIALRADATPGAVRWQGLWPAASAAMLAVYTSQELLEGALTAGHPTGLVGVFGGGGWVVVPLAAAAGAVVALLVRLARRVEAAVAGTVPRAWVLLAVPSGSVCVAGRVVVGRGRVLAEHMAGRGPPRGRPMLST